MSLALSLSVPLHRERLQKLYHKKLATLDLETLPPTPGASPLYGDVAPWGVCLYGNAHTPDHPESHFFPSLAALLETVLAEYAGFTIAAHNGGGYEFNYLLDDLRQLIATHDDLAVRTLHQGEKIIGYDLTRTSTRTLTRGPHKGMERVTQEHWYFVDTLPLFNMRLADIAQAFCPDLPKLDGVVNWRKEVWSYANPDHRRYLARDAEIVFWSYRRLEALVYDAFRCGVGRTAAGTALRAFRASIPPGHVYYRSLPRVEQFVRRGYRGGLVLPGATTAPIADVIALDMSGAYGYQMQTHTYPVGAPVHTYGYAEGYTGVYHCRVTTPRFAFFGIIAEEATGTYPLGEFETVCTSVEIEYAKRQGYTFEIYEGYYWTREEPVFQPFMAACQALEQQPGMKPLAKLLRNSLYGKFCTRTQAEEFHVLPPNASAPLGSFPLLDPTTGDQLEGIYALPVTIDAPYLMPVWGVLITAYQRVYLAERAQALYEQGAQTVYCDTDSLVSNRDAVAAVYARGLLDDTGVYGAWRVELEAALCLVAAPKVYTLLDARGQVLRAKAKGFPLRQLLEESPRLDAGTLQRTERFSFVSSHSIRDRLKHPEKPIRRIEKRRISHMADSPGWAYNQATGAIRPLIVYRERRYEDATHNSREIAT